MIMIALSVVSTIVVNLNVRNTKGIQGWSNKLFLHWLPRLLCMRLSNEFDHKNRRSSFEKRLGNVFYSHVHQQGRYDTNTYLGKFSEVSAKQQWLFAAMVVDRLCLVISLIFTVISVSVFLIYGF